MKSGMKLRIILLLEEARRKQLMPNRTQNVPPKLLEEKTLLQNFGSVVATRVTATPYAAWMDASTILHLEIDDTILEVTLKLKASFLVGDKNEDDLHIVSLVRSSNNSGYMYNGVHWKYAEPEDICLILANTTSKTAKKVNGSIFRGPIYSEEDCLDRKELCLKRIQARASYEVAS